MAEILDKVPEFWLPAEFLTDEDILIENKENQENLNKTTNPNNLFFPSEFPFDFENQLTELTRQLTLQEPNQITRPHQNFEKIQRKNYGNLGSPQSTLFQFGGYSGRSPISSNGGSPNGPSQVSSPTSHFAPDTNSLDLIYQAAAQVAKLKKSSVVYNSFVQRVREEEILKQQQQQRGNGWSNHQLKNGVGFQQQRQNRFAGLNVGGYFENEEGAWPSLQYMRQQNQQTRSGNGGSGNRYFNNVRKSSAGTGVFLPRHYENNCVQTKTNKKASTSNSFNVRGERNNAYVSGGGARPQWQPRCIGDLCTDHEIQLAQKNAMLTRRSSTNPQQQVALVHELGLPQEWTY